jgi:SWI/SNF-related matrix-associated actin-dependent regulator 1 of chromatin subfamily A
MPTAQERIACIPEGLRSKLMPYQKETVRFALKKHGRVLIADDMGLGKTVQAIACACMYRECWPVLVVCPAAVRYQWVDEWIKWATPVVQEDDIALVLTTKEEWPQRKLVYIMTYDIAIRRAARDLSTFHQKMAIVDESHYIKSMDSKGYKLLGPHLQRTLHCFMLSGTPAMSRPKELFSQLHILKPDLFRYWGTYAQHFCGARLTPWGWDYNGMSNGKELARILREHVMVRRLKADVGIQLPEKWSVYVRVGNTKKLDKQKEQYRKCLETMRDHDVSDAHRRLAKERMERCLTQMFTCTGALKQPYVIEYLRDYFTSTPDDTKVIVFAHHRAMLDAIETFCQSASLRYMRIDGSTDSEVRRTDVRRFQSDAADAPQVAILSITAAGTGVTLTAGREVIFAELHWTPAILMQAENRVHRIGQTCACTMRYLLLEGSSDDIMHKMVQRKERVLDTILDTPSEDPLALDAFLSLQNEEQAGSSAQ